MASSFESGSGSQGRSPLEVYTYVMDCKKTPFSSIKVHHSLNWIGYLLHDIMHLQKRGEGGGSSFSLPQLWRT